MKKNFLTLMFFVTIGIYNGYSQCWQPTFTDDFEGTSLDLNKWSYQTGNGCPNLCGWGNNELEYYTSSTNNVSVSQGQLAITARYEPNYNGTGNNFTSGKLVTSGKFSQKYGRYEARIKVPSATGVWPAFWMLPDNNNWPSTGEIDILEVKNLNPTLWHGYIHYASTSGSHQSKGNTWTSPEPLSNDFHLYVMEWDTQEIRWYIDGILRGTVTKIAVESGGGVWPFDNQNFYIILNVAVGGNFTGVNSRRIPTSEYPVSMLVDYVKVYEAVPCLPTSFVNITSPGNNASYDEGTEIGITANASFVDGTVAKVEFFSDGIKIGEDSISPYETIWSGASAGSHSLTAVATDGQGSTLTSNVVAINVVIPQLPFGGIVRDIPGRIEAEHYDTGGEGQAYHDLTSGNAGNVFRTDDVDIETTTDVDAGYNITGIQNSEFLEYTVNVTNPGTYRVDVRLSSPTKKYNLNIELDSQSIGSVSNNKPNGTTQWQTVSFTTPSLTVGQKIMKINMNMDGFKLNHVSFTSTSSGRLEGFSNNFSNLPGVYPNPASNELYVKLNDSDFHSADVSIINSIGEEVYKGSITSNIEESINLKGMEPGMYLVKVVVDGKVYMDKLLKE